MPLSAAVKTILVADGADDVAAASELAEVVSLPIVLDVAVVAVAFAPIEVLKREVLTSEICTVLSGTNLRLVAGTLVVVVGSRSGALSDDFTPDFNAVLLVDAGEETFFFPTFIGADNDAVDFDAAVEERRLK
jgi:hypothetical protein